MSFSPIHSRRVADEALLRAHRGSGGSGITQLLGDVLAGPGSGAVTATVARVNGATVPAAGALTPGQVLQVSGAAALVYAALNLATPASITGILPIGNGGTGLSAVGAPGTVLTSNGASASWQAPAAGGITQLTGDVTAGPGSGSQAATVARVNGATVPAAGALTPGNVLQVSGASSLVYGPVNLSGGANFVTGNLPVGNIAPGANTQVLTTVGGVATWAAPAASGITQLTQDVHAGPGTGSQAATVVQAQNGAVVFDVNGTVHGYLNSGSPNVGWSLGRDPSSISNVALFINANLGAGGDAFSSAIFNNTNTILNVPFGGTELDLAIASTPYVQLRTTELAIQDNGTLAAVTIFQSIAATAYPFRRIVSIFNASSDILPNSFVAGSVFLYTRTNTNGLAQGLVALGGAGAVSSIAPNGLGTLNSQAMEGLRERTAGRTLVGTTNTYVQTVPVAPGVFRLTVYVMGRLVTVGVGGGTIGDGMVNRYVIGGKNVGGTVTLTSSAADVLFSSDASMQGATFTFAPAAGGVQLTIDATAIGSGAASVEDWEVDYVGNVN